MMILPLFSSLPCLFKSKIVWLDALLMNVDRTARNTNMLTWRNELWLIDHGAALYFHHSGYHWEEQSIRPFTQIKDHVLLSAATKLEETDSIMKAILTPEKISSIVAVLPEEWLFDDNEEYTSAEIKEAYSSFLNTRISQSAIFVNEAQHARESFV